jgi:formiminotetrahydrofolate cyclodeaminase
LAADGLAPGGGSAAAITIAFAAKLTAMVANCSRATWEDAPGVVAQAAAIADRAAALARMDAAAWEAALTALRDAEAGSVDDRRRDFRLQQKLDAAAAVPLEIAALGADAAALAALAGERGDATYRADAAVAASLAAGAARATAYLVRVNLGVHGSDPRLARARASEAAAAEAAESLLDASL